MILAATGHRPNKLGGYNDELKNVRISIATDFLKEYTPEKCISGMALGWDTDFAIAAINLKIPLIAAIPFVGQEAVWSDKSKEEYFNILDKAFQIVEVSTPGYQNYKLLARNKWMVDNATDILALWDGSKGGTYHCVKYAEIKKKRIFNIWNKYEPYLDGGIK